MGIESIILDPEEAPLYKLVKRLRMAKGVKVEHKWIEDDLLPICATPVLDFKPGGRNICPKFVLCGETTCPFFHTADRTFGTVSCYRLNEIIDLVDVEA